jgi:transcriptional regulator with XRE-family HTH domain
MERVQDATVPTVGEWTGRETRALRQARRMSVRAFAERLGVAVRTVSKWEAGGAAVTPRPHMQAILDTALAAADPAAQLRFHTQLATLAGRRSDLDETPRRDLGTGDAETWADDLERATIHLTRQNFTHAGALLQRWLTRTSLHQLDASGRYLYARSLTVLGDLRRDEGRLLGPLSARNAYRQALTVFGEVGNARRVAQSELALVIITEMAGDLETAASHYQALALDERLARRDRARALLWMGTALDKHGDHDTAARIMIDALEEFAVLDEPEDWSVAHQKLALAHRGAGNLDQALHHMGVALDHGVDTSPLQQVRLQTAHAHILLSDPASRGNALTLLDDSERLAMRYGLTHQHGAIHAIRRAARTTRPPRARPLQGSR